MKKYSEKGRRLLRTIFRALGVTAVSLIFQACYGPPPHEGDEVTIHGSVKSKTTSEPIRGIKVSIEDTAFEGKTSNNGNFYVYLPKQDAYTVTFEDIDGPENGGEFKPYSKTVDTQGESPISIEVELEEVDEEADD